MTGNTLRRNKHVLIGILALLLIAVGASVVAAGDLQTSALAAQVNPDPEVAVLPATLERLSWGAIIAGTLVVLILMFLFNLIGLAIGMSTLRPETRDVSEDGGAIITRSLVWVIVSNLLALFVGGLFAGYFAGIPDGRDGMLHGILTWAISGIITALFVVSNVGRMVNGLAHLLSSSLSLAGNVAGTVAGTAAHGAANVVSGAGNLTMQTLGMLARGVQETAHITAQGLSNLTDAALENAPEVQNALSFQDLTRQDIEYQARRLMNQAGVPANQVQQQVSGAVEDVKNAAQQAIGDPQHAGEYLSLAIQRVFRRGEDVIGDVDRDSLVSVLTQNSSMNEEQARAQIAQWEQDFGKAKAMTQEARERARTRAEELRTQAEQKAQEVFEQAQTRAAEIQQEAENKLNEARAEAERIAREAADKASKGLAAAAGALAVALVLGAVAAGIGGSIGAPETIPVAEVAESDDDVVAATPLPTVVVTPVATASGG